MHVKNPPQFSYVIFGLGSIGKVHLSHILKNFNRAVVIDPDDGVRQYLKECNIDSRVDYFLSLESSQILEAPDIAVISNWGPDHFTTIQKCVDLGIKQIIVEKPLVSKLQDLEVLSNYVSSGKCKVVTNMPISQGPLPKLIQNAQHNEDLGPVQMILVSGGAKCLVTNGIHYVGLAMDIFGTFPENVFSSIASESVNPRSKEFMFVEGTSTWNFGSGKNLSISFTNRSHVQLCIEIFFTYGKMVIEGDKATTYSISGKDKMKIDKPSRTFYASEILGTFNPYRNMEGLDGMGVMYQKIQSEDPEFWNNFAQGSKATEAIIAMLISSEANTKIHLPLKKEIKSHFFTRDWQIS